MIISAMVSGAVQLLPKRWNIDVARIDLRDGWVEVHVHDLWDDDPAFEHLPFAAAKRSHAHASGAAVVGREDDDRVVREALVPQSIEESSVQNPNCSGGFTRVLHTTLPVAAVIFKSVACSVCYRDLRPETRDSI